MHILYRLANSELSEEHDSKQRSQSTKIKELCDKHGRQPESFRIRSASLDGGCVYFDCPLLVQRSMLRGCLLLDLVHI